MTKLSFFTPVAVSLLASQAIAFSPQARSTSFGLVALSQSASESAVDPFDAYQPGGELATKELKAGQGTACEEGDVLTINFAGSVMSSKKEFVNMELSYKVGGGNVMPGIDQGMRGAKEGTKRILRIPPTLAYGDTGKSGKVPPNADLEFEIEVQKLIPAGPGAELELFGTDRALGFLGCFALLALAPDIEKAINGVMASMN